MMTLEKFVYMFAAVTAVFFLSRIATDVHRMAVIYQQVLNMLRQTNFGAL
jgi:hypothetical protein